MRFVPVKNIEQQAILSVHRARQSFVKARTAQANQIRGLLAEYGIVVLQGISCIVKDVLKTKEAGGYYLPGNFQQLIAPGRSLQRTGQASRRT
jgi:transposase